MLSAIICSSDIAVLQLRVNDDLIEVETFISFSNHLNFNNKHPGWLVYSSLLF